MSLGPMNTDEPASTTERVYALLSAARNFTARPAALLFYLGVASLMVGLWANHPIHPAYWFVVGGMGLITLGQWTAARVDTRAAETAKAAKKEK